MFLQQETGVDQDSVLAYLSDGRRLRSENVRELAGAHDQVRVPPNTSHGVSSDDLDVLCRLFMCTTNDTSTLTSIVCYKSSMLTLRWTRRSMVSAPISSNCIPANPLHKEAIDATPPFKPSQLAITYLQTAHIHKEHVNNTLNNLRYQHEALRIASTSLDLNVLAIMDVFEGISQSAQKDLEKQEALLAGVDADLEIISRVKIHAEFMSPATRKAVEAGERARTLGDYVSNVKMKQVAETCARTHGDLRSMFTQVEDAVAKLNHGTDEVRFTASATGYSSRSLNSMMSCSKRLQGYR